MQRVFGFTHRLPNSIVSDDVIDPNYLSEHPMDDFVKAQQLRQAAQKAWAAIDSRNKILKVLRARHIDRQTIFKKIKLSTFGDNLG